MSEPYFTIGLLFFAMLVGGYYYIFWLPKRVNANFDRGLEFAIDFRAEYGSDSNPIVLGFSLEEGKIVFADYRKRYVLHCSEVGEWYFVETPVTNKDGSLSITYTMKILPKHLDAPSLKLTGLTAREFDELEMVRVAFRHALEERDEGILLAGPEQGSFDTRVEAAINLLRRAGFKPEDRFRDRFDMLSRFQLGVQILVDHCESQGVDYDGGRDKPVLKEALAEFFLRREDDPGDVGYKHNSFLTKISEETSAYVKSKPQRSSS